MRGSIDSRQFRIYEYEEPANDSTLRSLIVFSLPTEQEIDLDDIPQMINEEISAIYQDQTLESFVGFSIRDVRQRHEIGASGATQEIVLAIVTGAAEGVAAVTVHLLVKKLSSRLWKLYGRNVSSPSLATDIDRVIEMVRHNFNPQGRLEALEISPSKIVLKDSNESRYIAEIIEEAPDNITIKKLRIGE